MAKKINKIIQYMHFLRHFYSTASSDEQTGGYMSCSDVLCLRRGVKEDFLSFFREYRNEMDSCCI